MNEPIDNYPLSTERSVVIPLDIAKPSAFYWLTANTSFVQLTFPEDDNNIFSITADELTFISTNPAISSAAQLQQGPNVNNGIYVVTPGYSHVLALPKQVRVFSALTSASKNIYFQQLVRWAAAGGQAISYGAS